MAKHHETGFPKYLSFMSNRLLETVVWTFAELGIADLLQAADKPQTADELAQKQGWNSEFLYRLLRAVADADIVRELKADETLEPEKTNRFELTEDGHFLTSNHPSKARYLICWELSLIVKTASNYLPQLVREGYNKGTGLQQATETETVFEFLEKRENRNSANDFNETMTSLSMYSCEPVVNAVDFSRFNKIVDIGGSSGTLVSHILRKYSTIKQGICFDSPKTIEQAKLKNEFEKQNISKDRYAFVAGDMFDTKTIPQADAYIMKNVIHNWKDDRAIDTLKSIRTAANGNHITIFIIDFIILPENEQNKFIDQFTHAFDLHMMIVVGSKERTKKQYEYLLEESGFIFQHLYHTETPCSIIEAVTN
jgi:hypothetical protein